MRAPAGAARRASVSVRTGPAGETSTTGCAPDGVVANKSVVPSRARDLLLARKGALGTGRAPAPPRARARGPPPPPRPGRARGAPGGGGPGAGGGEPLAHRAPRRAVEAAE